MRGQNVKRYCIFSFERYAHAAVQNSPENTFEKQILKNALPGAECTQTLWYVQFSCKKYFDEIFGLINQFKKQGDKNNGM